MVLPRLADTAGGGHPFRTALAVSPSAGSFAAVLFAGEGERGLRVARELGYDAVDLSVGDPHDEAFTAAARAAPSMGLAITALATGRSFFQDGLQLGMPDPRRRAELVGRLQEVVEAAAEHGSQVIIGSVRGRLEGPPAARGAQRARMIEDLGVIVSRASELGVPVLVEPINRYETNSLNTVAQAIEVIRELGAPNLGILADTFHMNIEETSMVDALRLAGPWLRHVQFSDSNRRAAGQGHIDFEELAAVLREIGYQGHLAAEILPLPDSRTAAAQALATMRAL